MEACVQQVSKVSKKESNYSEHPAAAAAREVFNHWVKHLKAINEAIKTHTYYTRTPILYS